MIPPVDEAFTRLRRPKRLVVPVTPRVDEALRAPEKIPVVEKSEAIVPTVVEANAAVKLVVDASVE